MERPNHIKPAHWQEWTIESGIDPNLTALNVQSLTGATAFEYLIYSETIPRRNDGRLTDHWLKKYRHLEHGGWWCGTVSDSLWGCFKPNQPRRNRDNKKPIKYEHPPKVATGLFLLKVPLKLWKRIAKRYKVPMPKYLFLYTREKRYELFWKWVIKHNIPVIITEGVKKAAILITKGYVGIAIPGIFNGYRQPKDPLGYPTGNPTLIPDLARFATPGREIYFGFDSDKKPKTIANVNKAISQTGWLLEQQGAIVQVINWKPELGKGVDDLIVNHGVQAFEAAHLVAKPLAVWKANQLGRLTYEPNIQVNSRYLDNIPLPKDAKLVGLKSAKGTGKTELIAQWVADALHKGQWVLVLTHRIQLGEALCERFGVPYVTELRDSDIGGLLGYGLCVDSLHPHSQAQFKAQDWTDGLVILDEAEQVIWHMLNSATCQSERVPILKSFKTLIQNAFASDGQVILSDANLSNVSIEYIQKLAGVNTAPFIIQNDCQPSRWQVYQYGGNSPSSLVAGLLAHIKGGGKPFVCVSGQKRKSKWSTTTLESYLRQHFPDLRILRIDSESVSDPTHPAYCCISKLNQILLEYDIVIASPSIETGVSIDIEEHFTSVWGITHGICSVWSFLQSLARVRPNVPRHIWAARYGLGRIGNGSSSFKSLRASVDKLTRANVRLLEIAGCDALDAGGVFQSESFVAWAKMAARINATMSCYREAVVEALLDEGHTIIDVDAVNQDFHVEDKGHSVDGSRVDGADSSRVDGADSSRVDGADSSRVIGTSSNQVIGADGCQVFGTSECQVFGTNVTRKDGADDNQIGTSECQVFGTSECQVFGIDGSQVIGIDGSRKNGAEDERTLSLKPAECNLSVLKQIEADITQTRDANYETERVAISMAAQIDDKQYEMLKDQRAKTIDERQQERKHALSLRYGINVSPSLVAMDDAGLYPKLRLYYFLLLGREYLADRDKRAALAQVSTGDGDVWQPDFNAGMLGLRVAVLDRLGITALLSQPERELRISDVEVQAIAALVKSNPWLLKTILGLTVGKNEAPIRIVGRLLSLVGVELECVRREGSRGNRQRVYRLVIPDDGRDEIFQVWLERDKARRDVSTNLIDL